MKRVVLLLVLCFLSLLVSAVAQEQPYHLKLLAVQEDAKGYQGSDADLYLEIKEGSGRVFLETFPLTKLDTQISTRFAKDVACNHFKLDCNRYDFIFTIKAKAAIIGGPSAGAAIAALTTIALLDLPYDQKATITGTINSGGVIGPVGGVKEKLEAAANSSLTKVLIPQGTAKQNLPERELNASTVQNESNDNRSSFNLIDYGRDNLSLNVVEVIDLDTVLWELTGVDLNHKTVNVTEDTEYARIMNGLQDALCGRGTALLQEIENEGIILDNETKTQYRIKAELADNASQVEDYYSAASFCFGNNILLRGAYYQQKKFSVAEFSRLFAIVEQKAGKLDEKIQQEAIETISDLQTLMIVNERVEDVRQQIQRFHQENKSLGPEETSRLLAYAEERFFSALAWYQFFAMTGKKFVVDPLLLERSCQLKIAESEERYQYASLFLGFPGSSFIREKIDTAKHSLEEKEFALCLILAAQAKADANAIVSSLGVDDSAIKLILESKRKAVERIIFENSAEGVFPILGYSYYRYASSLQEQETYNALVYLEYALEMSDLSMYFPEQKTLLEKISWRVLADRDFLLLGKGFLTGVLITLLVVFLRPRRTQKKR